MNVARDDASLIPPQVPSHAQARLKWSEVIRPQPRERPRLSASTLDQIRSTHVDQLTRVNYKQGKENASFMENKIQSPTEFRDVIGQMHTEIANQRAAVTDQITGTTTTSSMLEPSAFGLLAIGVIMWDRHLFSAVNPNCFGNRMSSRMPGLLPLGSMPLFGQKRRFATPLQHRCNPVAPNDVRKTIVYNCLWN